MNNKTKPETFETDPLLQKCRSLAEKHEEAAFQKKAAFSKDHSRYYGAENDHRLPYKRDVDRIIHSKAYARYIDKTQVAYLVHNDHITHRSLHVQLVSNFARGIAEILGLNLDLVEAISLGHDVGHPPFGHEGEGYLSQLSQEYGGGQFAHPLQSCRLFTEIEPLNLGLAVYDGFLCHDGGMCGTKFIPNYGKSWDDHFAEREQKMADPDKNIWPATLEGCLVKMCDTMSYLGRDMEDAIILGLLDREEIPSTVLGKTNRQMLSVLACDVIKHSYQKDYIAFSDEVYEALKAIRKFNFDKIYSHPKLKVESKKIEKSYRILFEHLLDELIAEKKNSYIWKNFIQNKAESYIAKTAPVTMVVDYISGMTDTYFVRTFEKLIVPQSIRL
jgi:dGTPase